MLRTVAGLVVLLLAFPALADDDKPKDKSKESDKKTSAEQYQALVKEFNDARQTFFKEYQEAKTQEDKQKVLKEKQPQPDKYAAKFLALAEKNPKEPVAVDALMWVLQNTFSFGPANKDSPRAKAVAILTRDYIQSDKLGPLCQMLVYSQDKESEALLRALLEKNPHKDVQGQACLALAQQLNNRRRGQQGEPAKEVVELFERAADKYGDVKLQYFGTIGDKAKAELFEIRHLTVGKEAPDIEGEDQDGKKFKLSDYKGKVVMLDFWSQY
jgi:hypothetical protein